MVFDIYKPTLNCKELGPSYVWFINSSRYGSSTIKPTFLQMNFAKDWGHIGSRSSFWGAVLNLQLDLFQSQQAWKVTSRRRGILVLHNWLTISRRLSPLPDYATIISHLNHHCQPVSTNMNINQYPSASTIFIHFQHQSEATIRIFTKPSTKTIETIV
jgi:hypothetical protein